MLPSPRDILIKKKGRGKQRSRQKGENEAGWSDDDAAADNGALWGKQAGGGGTGAPKQPRKTWQPAPLLNEAGVKKLEKLFEGLCAHRGNLEHLTEQLGGK
jgi:hypothetical protein